MLLDSLVITLTGMKSTFASSVATYMVATGSTVIYSDLSAIHRWEDAGWAPVSWLVWTVRVSNCSCRLSPSSALMLSCQFYEASGNYLATSSRYILLFNESPSTTNWTLYVTTNESLGRMRVVVDEEQVNRVVQHTPLHLQCEKYLLDSLHLIPEFHS